MSKFLTIYEPSSAPIRGLASAKISAMIPPGSGYFAMIQNLRWGENGVLTVKSGAEEYGQTTDPDFQLPTGQQPRGFTNIPIADNPGYTFLGLADISALPANRRTAVYLTTSMQSWKEITDDNDAGKHKNTRLETDNGDDYETTFQVVYDRFEKQHCLIIQNGYDFPRVAGPIDSGTAAIHQPISPPTRSNNWGAMLTWKSYFLVNDYHWVTYSSSPTNYDVVNSDTSVVGNNTVQLRHEDDVPSGAITITFKKANNDLVEPDPDPGVTVKMDGSDCRQLALVVRPFEGDAGVSHFLQNFKIAIPNPSAPSSPYVIADPSNTAKQPTVVPADLSSRTYVVACSLDEVPTSVISAFNEIILEPISTAVAPDDDYKLDILCIAATGNVPGNVSYAVSYFNRDSRAESYEQVLATRPNGIDSLGSKYLSHLQLPNSELLYYKCWISFQNPLRDEIERGTDFLRIYRKHHSVDAAHSEQAFTYVAAAHIAEYISGVWDFTQDTEELQLRGTPDNFAPEDRLLWLTSPGAFQQTIPISRCMTQAGNRLICGARLEEDDAFPRLCASGVGMPFRFSSLSFDQDDLSAPFEQEVAGENLQGFAVAAGASLGTNVVYLFTDQAVWMLNLMAVGTPTLLSREMSVGTDSPLTIAERHGRVYFLDTHRQVRLISSGGSVASSVGETPIALSRGVVDDLLTAIPQDRVRDTRGLWFNNRYYLFYSRPSVSGDLGDSYNSQCLIFSEHMNAWESRDAFEGDLKVECPVTWRPKILSSYAAKGLPRLMTITNDCKIFQLESPGNDQDDHLVDDDVPIEVQLKTGDLHEALWTGMHVKGIGVLADDQAQSLTASVSYKPTSAVSSFAISLDSTNPYRWLVQRSQSAAANGIAAEVNFAGSVLGGKRIYALKMEVEPREMLAPKGE